MDVVHRVDHLVKDKITYLPNFIRKFLVIFSFNPKFIYVFLIIFAFANEKANIFILTLCFFIADLFIWVIKRAIKRARPMYEDKGILGLTLGFGTDKYSFPSAHTFTAFQLIPLFYTLSTSWGLVYIIYALLVATSRISMSHHFFSDVFASMVIGLIIGVVLVSLIKI